MSDETKQKIDDGGPAFPSTDEYPCHSESPRGMSTRTWLAARAAERDIQIQMEKKFAGGIVLRQRTREEARFAYADAMLAQLRKDSAV